MRNCLVILVTMLSFTVSVRAADPSSLWDMTDLSKPPHATWGATKSLVQELYYEGEPYLGKPTRVFAYYGRPISGSGPFPAVVLAHGGGGKAFYDWADHWAKRGYVALAMDLAGNGPDGRLDDGGPDQPDEIKFQDFSDADIKDMWTYQAAAAVIRANSLLRSRPEVNPDRIALTGISWGGYLTCIVAGVDHRFKAAVPVYGCGFLNDDGYWAERLSHLPQQRRQRWLDHFDPSRYLGCATCPMLFVDGTNDEFYPMDSLQKSYQLVKSPVSLSLQIGRKHAHIWTFPEVDAFIDSQVNGGQPLPKLGEVKSTAGMWSVEATSPDPITTAELDYTTNTGPWRQRQWHRAPAMINGKKILVALPAQRPLVGFLYVTDQRGLSVSTPYMQLTDGK